MVQSDRDQVGCWYSCCSTMVIHSMPCNDDDTYRRDLAGSWAKRHPGRLARRFSTWGSCRYVLSEVLNHITGMQVCLCTRKR
jgi:hypothetical protein